MWSLEQAIEEAAVLNEQDFQRRIDSLSDDELRKLAEQTVRLREGIRQEEQVRFYQPVNEEAKKIHLSVAKEVVTVGGNRSSKTDTHLVEMVIQMTGIVPVCLEGVYPSQKLRCPIRARIVCESLTNTWEPVIKPKLQYDKWNGRGETGGPFGHWGWIPKAFLTKGKWEDSWSEKTRTLTLTCGCTMNVMSYDQDVGDFSGGSFQLILHDEGPPHSIYRENKMRTIDVGGRLMIAMTPPDDESAAWDAAWVYDELYEKGLGGPSKDPNIDSFTLFTEHNRILQQSEIDIVFKGLSPRQKEVRGHGRFLHLGGRIYPLYTDRTQLWCFTCNDIALMDNDGNCVTCHAKYTTEFCHYVEPFDLGYNWPCVFLLDPHPRKANMMSWVVIDPSDDQYQVGELEVDGDPVDVWNKVRDFEKALGVNVVKRLVDPNMGESPAHSAGKRNITVRQEYDAVGLRCALADDNFTTGKNRVTALLKPDPKTRSPRLHIFTRCPITNSQMNKFSWDEYTRYSSDMRDPKARPREKHDDFPKLLGYLENSNPTFAGLMMGAQPYRRSDRVGAY